MKRCLFLLAAIACGGYAYGTPGLQPIAAAACGLFVAMYERAEK